MKLKVVLFALTGLGNEVLKCILNSKNDLTNHVLIFDSLKTEFRKSKISINPKCINKC